MARRSSVVPGGAGAGAGAGAVLAVAGAGAGFSGLALGLGPWGWRWPQRAGAGAGPWGWRWALRVLDGPPGIRSVFQCTELRVRYMLFTIPVPLARLCFSSSSVSGHYSNQLCNMQHRRNTVCAITSSQRKRRAVYAIAGCFDVEATYLQHAAEDCKEVDEEVQAVGNVVTITLLVTGWMPTCTEQVQAEPTHTASECQSGGMDIRC